MPSNKKVPSYWKSGISFLSGDKTYVSPWSYRQIRSVQVMPSSTCPTSTASAEALQIQSFPGPFECMADLSTFNLPKKRTMYREIFTTNQLQSGQWDWSMGLDCWWFLWHFSVCLISPIECVWDWSPKWGMDMKVLLEVQFVTVFDYKVGPLRSL